MRHLFGLVIQCVNEGHAEPVIASSRQVAADRFGAGLDIAEAGRAFNVLEEVLSCDLVIADETATFAITAANLGLPYNTTGLLHFVGRLPSNVIKEMFFTAAPIDARQAKEWRWSTT